MTKSRAIARAVSVAVTISLLAACAQGSTDNAGEAAASNEGGVDEGTQMQLTAAEGLQQAMEDSFSPEQITLLTSAAHQLVVSQTCDGFELDSDKAKAELAKLHQDKDGNELQLSPEEKDALEKKSQLGFGMAIGSQLTISGYDQQAFCDQAREEKPDSPDEPGYILKTSG